MLLSLLKRSMLPGIAVLSIVFATAAAPGPREGYQPVPGGKVWFRIYGEEKPRPALIALHGGPGASHLCFEALAPLADERPVILYDQLGCGKSDHPADVSLWTIDRYVEELDQLIKGLRLRKVILLGHSWGSMLAFEYMTRKHPDNVTSLILAGACFSASRWLADQRAYLREFPAAMQEIVRKAEATGNFESREYQDVMDAYYRKHLCRLDPWPECLQEAMRGLNPDVYVHMWGPSEFTATGTLKGYERTSRLRELRLPVLFTCGEYDEASPATTRYYSSLLPGSKVVEFPGASHCHIFERPSGYVAAVRAFLRESER
jgi:proline iminopeptidase